MAIFDSWLASQKKNPIYEGDPPTDEADYKKRVSFPEGETAPSWSEVEAGVALQKVMVKRLHEYFSNDPQGLSKQLEKIYDDIDAGTLDKTGKFYKFIKDIKTANPKPS